jgi:hypothetical protein
VVLAVVSLVLSMRNWRALPQKTTYAQIGTSMRTRPITASTETYVRDLDKVCVGCGASDNLFVQRIAEYGGNGAKNLRLVCQTCGGRLWYPTARRHP